MHEKRATEAASCEIHFVLETFAVFVGETFSPVPPLSSPTLSSPHLVLYYLVHRKKIDLVHRD